MEVNCVVESATYVMSVGKDARPQDHKSHNSTRIKTKLHTHIYIYIYIYTLKHYILKYYKVFYVLVVLVWHSACARAVICCHFDLRIGKIGYPFCGARLLPSLMRAHEQETLARWLACCRSCFLASSDRFFSVAMKRKKVQSRML